MKGMKKRQSENAVRRDRLTGRGRALIPFFFTDAVRFAAYRAFYFWYFTAIWKNPEPIA